jgi:hypothetical protein
VVQEVIVQIGSQEEETDGMVTLSKLHDAGWLNSAHRKLTLTLALVILFFNPQSIIRKIDTLCCIAS